MNRILIGLGLAATLTLGGCATAPTTPAAPAAPAAPATTPAAATTSAAPTSPTTTPAGPTASATSTRRPLQDAEVMILPSDKGTAFADVKLPREAEKTRHEEEGPWEPMAFPLACVDGVGIQPATLTQLTDARVRGRAIPEGLDIDGLVRFADEAAAKAFMAEITASYGACAPIGPESRNQGTAEDPLHERSLIATGRQDAPGVEALSVRTWTERKIDDKWLEAPGGTVTLFARDGRHVAVASSSGEYVGDVTEELEPGAILFKVAQDLLAMAG